MRTVERLHFRLTEGRSWPMTAMLAQTGAISLRVRGARLREVWGRTRRLAARGRLAHASQVLARDIVRGSAHMPPSARRELAGKTLGRFATPRPRCTNRKYRSRQGAGAR